MSYANSKFNVNAAERRFEMTIDNNVAFINYKQGGKKIYLIHTEVPAVIEGKGVASALVAKTLQYIDEQHWQLIPMCTFVQSYLEKHPEWKRVVKEENE